MNLRRLGSLIATVAAVPVPLQRPALLAELQA